MTPFPPTAISGRVKASSPESTLKSPGTARQISHIWVMFAEASFTPTMFGMAANLTSVATSMLHPVLPGTLYTMIGRAVLSAIDRKCWYMPSGLGLL